MNNPEKLATQGT